MEPMYKASSGTAHCGSAGFDRPDALIYNKGGSTGAGPDRAVLIARPPVRVRDAEEPRNSRTPLTERLVELSIRAA